MSTGLSARKMVLINSIEADNDLLSKIGFTVSTFDAPLDVRSNSYYVSNLTGTAAFNEIIGLIIKSKY
jgi:3-deoxy-D-manno-octulosonate 8-phosphate phosphatase KdsC-like HAD superfamily phosphatase